MSDVRGTFWTQLATLEMGARPPARAHPRIRTPSRPRLVLQRTVDQGGWQHRHRPRNLAGAGGAIRDQAFRALLAPGHRRRQVGRERRHPRPRAVGAARIPSLPRPLAPLANQPPVPALLEPAGGAQARTNAAGAPPRAGDARDGARRANIGDVKSSDQRGIVRGCCLGLIVLLIMVGGSVVPRRPRPRRARSRSTAGGSVSRRQRGGDRGRPRRGDGRRSSSRGRTASWC